MILTVAAFFQEALFWVYAFIVFVLVLGIIILLHEGGHFFFAKRAGIFCHEFSIGMGPLIKQKKKGETFYSIRAIPVGGYVSMAGEDTNEQMIKIDSVVGVNFKKVFKNSLVLNGTNDGEEIEVVSDIILTDKMESTVSGQVVAYDLYSENGEAMYLDLAVDGEVKRYLVARDAMYHFNAKQKMQVTPYDRCFEAKGKLPRFLTIVAGPMMNFVLALFIFIIVGLATGVPNEESTVIGELSANYPAASVLEVGDEIVSVDGTKVSTWTEFSAYMDTLNGKETIEMVVNRDGNQETVTISTVIISYRLGVANMEYLDYTGDGIKITKVFADDYVVGAAGLNNGDIILGYYNENNQLVETNDWATLLAYIDSDEKMSSIKLKCLVGEDQEARDITSEVWTESSLDTLGVEAASKTAIGVSPDMHFSFFGGLGNAFVLFWNSISAVFKTLGALFGNSQIGVGDLSGPVGIFQMIKQYLSTDIISFLSFVGLISANIGLVNLLPIPALDGGRIVFILYELVTKKKVNKKVETVLNNIVFYLLMALFVFITFKDILRFF